MAATAPKQLNNFGDMYAEGLMTDSKPLKKKATELRDFMQEDKFKLAQLKMMQDMSKMEAKASLQKDPRLSKVVEKQANLYSNWSNKLADSETKLNMLEHGLIQNDNAIIQGSAPTVLAKAMGEVGALTEADKAPYQGSLAVASRISQFFETNKSGKLTPENRKLLLGLVQKLKQSMNKRKEGNSKLLSSQLSKHATKLLGTPLAEDEARSYITGEETVPANSEQESAPVKKTSRYLSF